MTTATAIPEIDAQELSHLAYVRMATAADKVSQALDMLFDATEDPEEGEEGVELGAGDGYYTRAELKRFHSFLRYGFEDLVGGFISAERTRLSLKLEPHAIVFASVLQDLADTLNIERASARAKGATTA
jgi:hypothetical protein